jgi:glycosyltransferase involved in cell wall biosynthesis
VFEEYGKYPMISIIIPTYNRANLLPRAIESIVEQTCSSWELLIIDDGSTDNTEEVLQKYLSSKVRYVKCPHSGLPAIARNVGIHKAQGEWIAFLDSDDVWLPEKLEKQMQVIRDYVSGPDRKAGIYFEELLLDNFIVASTVLVRRDCLLEIGGFNESSYLLVGEDYELWLRLSITHKIEYLSEPLVIYRDLPEEGIRGSQSRLGYWKGILKIYCNLRKIRAKQGLQSSRVLQDRIFSTRMELYKIYFKWESSFWNLLRSFLRLISSLGWRMRSVHAEDK